MEDATITLLYTLVKNIDDAIDGLEPKKAYAILDYIKNDIEIKQKRIKSK